MWLKCSTYASISAVTPSFAATDVGMRRRKSSRSSSVSCRATSSASNSASAYCRFSRSSGTSDRGGGPSASAGSSGSMSEGSGTNSKKTMPSNGTLVDWSMSFCCDARLFCGRPAMNELFRLLLLFTSTGATRPRAQISWPYAMASPRVSKPRFSCSQSTASDATKAARRPFLRDDARMTPASGRFMAVTTTSGLECVESRLSTMWCVPLDCRMQPRRTAHVGASFSSDSTKKSSSNPSTWASESKSCTCRSIHFLMTLTTRRRTASRYSWWMRCSSEVAGRKSHRATSASSISSGDIK
mmetsp:Transcript_3004/g.9820  ORF Transcript_3004/g.9820 Transcript_3004/m.9820 type:complete len:299 (-) Transcript_3004:773-1669(-)